MTGEEPKASQDDIRTYKNGSLGRLSKTQTAFRDLEVLRLKKKGVPFRVIATELGFADESSAYKAFKRIMKAHVSLEVDEYRAIEIEDILEIYSSIADLVKAGPEAISIELSDGTEVTGIVPRKHQLEAIDRAIRLKERLAKLVGMDAPTKSEVAGLDGAPFVIQMGWPVPDPNTEVVEEEDLPKS